MIGTQAKENACLMGWGKSWNIDEESEVFCYKRCEWKQSLWGFIQMYPCIIIYCVYHNKSFCVPRIER